MKYYSIGEVSEITKISKDRIRNYEKSNIICPDRDKYNDYRIYSDLDIIKLQAIELYRYADYSIDDVKKICTDISIDALIEKADNKELELKEQIKKLKQFVINNSRIKENCLKISQYLNKYYIGYFNDYEEKGEISDYKSFEEYKNIYSLDNTDKPLLNKLQRKIIFDNTGLLSNKMIITKESTRKIKCLYTIVQDVYHGKTLDTTFGNCMEYCKKNSIKTLGTAYVGMLLLLSESGKIVSYLEVKIIIK